MGPRSSDLDESLVPLVFLVTLVLCLGCTSTWWGVAMLVVVFSWCSIGSIGHSLDPFDHTITDPNVPWDLGYVSLHVGEWYLVWAG